MPFLKRSVAPLAALCLLASAAHAFDSVQLKTTLQAPGSAKTFTPNGVAIDTRGRCWVTDAGSDALQRFSADGKWQKTIGHHGAGVGELSQPHGIAIAADGRLYVADSANHRIAIFSAEGEAVGTFGVKGTALGHFDRPWTIAISGDGVVAVAEKDAARVQLFSADGVFYQAFDSGSPVDGLAIDETGRLLISHAKQKLVELRSVAGQFLTSFNGSEPGMPGFQTPGALAVLPSGLSYIADPVAHQFRELDPSGRSLSAFGRRGSGPGQFRAITAIAVSSDTLAIADGRLHRVSIFTLTNAKATPALVAKPTLSFTVQSLASLALDVDRLTANTAGLLDALSLARSELIHVDLATRTTTQMDLVKNFGIKTPSAITTAPSSGALFVADAGGSRVVKIDRAGKLVLVFGKSTTFLKRGKGELSRPQGIACSSQGVLFVADPGNVRFDAFNHQGLFQFSGGEKGTGIGQLKTPVSIAVDKDRLYVADPGNRKVAVFNAAGRFLREISDLGPESLIEPRAVTVDREGNLFVLDAARGRIVIFDPDSKYLGAFGTLGVGAGLLSAPRAFALSEREDLYVAEDKRVQVFHIVLAPPVPMGLVATNGEGYVTLHWNPVALRHAPQYIVYRREASGALSLIKETSETSASDGTLTPDTTYTYMVAVKSVAGGLSALSTAVTAFVQPLTGAPRLEILSAATSYNGDHTLTIERGLPFKLYSRNTIRWDRKEHLAAFITPNDPPLLDFARHLATPFLQAHAGAPLPDALTRAWILFSGLSTYGINYLPRPTNPYDNAHLDSSTVDTLQFARETLTRQSGNCADVVALLSSAFEGLHVPTAALEAPGHLFMMFDTGESDLSTLGLPQDELVHYAGTFWIPLEATLVGSSFGDAWKKGAEEYRRWAHDKAFAIMDTHRAWESFEPVTLPESPARAVAPAPGDIEAKFLSDWKALVDLRWRTRLAAARSAAAQAPKDGTPWLRMGYLAVQYHRFAEARQFFARAQTDPASAAAAENNLGNLAYLRGDYAAAEASYMHAAQKDPNDAQILVNLVRLFQKQKKSAPAMAAYEKAVKLDPRIKESFPNLAALVP